MSDNIPNSESVKIHNINLSYFSSKEAIITQESFPQPPTDPCVSSACPPTNSGLVSSQCTLPSQPVSLATLGPCVTPQVIRDTCNMQRNLANAVSATSKANVQLIKEQELKSTIDKSCQIVKGSGQLCAYTKGKELKPVLSKIPSIYRIDIDFHYSVPSYYILAFSDPSEYCYIPVSDICKPKKLEAALAQHAPSVQFFVFGAEKKLILESLSQFFRMEATVYSFPYFLGWGENAEQFTFSLLDNTTHGAILPRSPEEIKDIEQFEGNSTATAIIAIQKIAELFNSIEDVAIRQLLFIWWHISFLYTLLAKHKFEPPVGLCIVCKNHRIYREMEKILAWYSDPPISNSKSTNHFLEQLAKRKDQPLLIHYQSSSTETDAYLLNIIKSHTIPPHQKHGLECPLQAPITLLTPSNTNLIRSPLLLTVEVDSLNEENLQLSSSISDLWKDYFHRFAYFTTNNLATLLEMLNSSNCSDDSDAEFDTSLSFEGVEFLALYRGIQKFLQTYLNTLDPMQSSVSDAISLLTENDAFLIKLIERSSDSKEYDCERFMEMTQSALQSGSICLIDLLETCPPEYFDKE